MVASAVAARVAISESSWREQASRLVLEARQSGVCFLRPLFRSSKFLGGPVVFHRLRKVAELLAGTCHADVNGSVPRLLSEGVLVARAGRLVASLFEVEITDFDVVRGFQRQRQGAAA